MGPDRFWFFGFKALQKCKNFEIWTIFRYCKMRSKFYYITRLRDMGENSKIDFFQGFNQKQQKGHRDGSLGWPKTSK